MTIQQQKIISAFPGTGKTYFCHNGDYSHYYPEKFCIDSDSSLFDKKNFPDNYIQEIKRRLSEGYSNILVSSHKELREALRYEGIPFYLVYPHHSLKDEYISRYKNRGNSDQFISMMEANWGDWMVDLRNQKGCNHIELKSNQYLTDIIWK